jgi:hypothetical protein
MQLALYGSPGATPRSDAVAIVPEEPESAAIHGVAFINGYYRTHNSLRPY